MMAKFQIWNWKLVLSYRTNQIMFFQNKVKKFSLVLAMFSASVIKRRLKGTHKIKDMAMKTQ